MKRMIQSLTAVLALVLVIGVAAMAAGCSSGMQSGSAGYDNAYSSQYVMSGLPETDGGDFDFVQTNDTSPPEGQERKVTRTAHLLLQTKDFDSVLAQLDSAIASSGGYKSDSDISGLDISHEEHQSRYGTLTVKVPAQNYTAFIEAVEELANVTSKSESEEDITTQYYDTSTRLESLLIWEERLLSMLQYAETLEDMLQLEQQLMEVRQEIQYYNEMMNVYSNKVNYATVFIRVQELLDTQVVPQGFFGDIGETFGDSFNSFLRFIEVIVTALIYLLPYLIAVGIVVVIVVVISRSARKRRANRPAPAPAERPTQAPPTGAYPQSGYPQQSYPQQGYPQPQEPSEPQDPPADPQV